VPRVGLPARHQLAAHEVPPPAVLKELRAGHVEDLLQHRVAVKRVAFVVGERLAADFQMRERVFRAGPVCRRRRLVGVPRQRRRERQAVRQLPERALHVYQQRLAHGRRRAVRVREAGRCGIVGAAARGVRHVLEAADTIDGLNRDAVRRGHRAVAVHVCLDTPRPVQRPGARLAKRLLDLQQKAPVRRAKQLVKQSGAADLPELRLGVGGQKRRVNVAPLAPPRE